MRKNLYLKNHDKKIIIKKEKNNYLNNLTLKFSTSNSTIKFAKIKLKWHLQ